MNTDFAIFVKSIEASYLENKRNKMTIATFLLTKNINCDLNIFYNLQFLHFDLGDAFPCNTETEKL